MRNRILILVAVLAGAAIGALYGGVFRDRTSAASAALAGAQATEDFKAGFALNASTASLIADLQSRLRVSPKDEHSYTLLGLAYQQRARETGDPSWYTKSDGVLRRALASKVSGFVPKSTPAEDLAHVIRDVAAGRRYVDPEIDYYDDGDGDGDGDVVTPGWQVADDVLVFKRHLLLEQV